MINLGAGRREAQALGLFDDGADYDVNPAPYYSLLCSAVTLTAVYKAHCVTDFTLTTWQGLDLHDWRNLSYATDRGIVFA